MPVKVYLRNLRIAPRKVRLVADLVRGLKADEALEQLRYMPKRSAGPVMKLLKSAIAAAANDHKIAKEDLFISKLTVDDGMILKRSMPHAMGRAFSILKRTSTVTIELDKKMALLEEPGKGKDSDLAKGLDGMEGKESKIDKSAKKKAKESKSK